MPPCWINRDQFLPEGRLKPLTLLQPLPIAGTQQEGKNGETSLTGLFTGVSCPVYRLLAFCGVLAFFGGLRYSPILNKRWAIEGVQLSFLPGFGLVPPRSNTSLGD